MSKNFALLPSAKSIRSDPSTDDAKRSTPKTSSFSRHAARLLRVIDLAVGFRFSIHPGDCGVAQVLPRRQRARRETLNDALRCRLTSAQSGIRPPSGTAVRQIRGASWGPWATRQSIYCRRKCHGRGDTCSSISVSCAFVFVTQTRFCARCPRHRPVAKAYPSRHECLLRSDSMTTSTTAVALCGQ